MKSLNKDTVIALILMAVAGTFFWETFNIPKFGYASIGSEVWPRVILVPLLVLCAVYLVQSVRRKAAAEGRTLSAGTFFATYRNPILCFVIFLVFLATLDYLGMLLGGSALVFALLTVLGNNAPRNVLIHIGVSVASVGLVWLLFTFVLRVYLPEGEILHLY